MKHLLLFESTNPTFDYFNSQVNMDIIERLKDICFNDNEYVVLSYFIKVGEYTILSGSYQRDEDIIPDDLPPSHKEYLAKSNKILKDWNHWTNYYNEHFLKVKELFKTNPIKYTFRISKIGISGRFDGEVEHELQSKVLKSIKISFPNENIDTY